AAPPAWVYHVASSAPGGADPVLHGSGGLDRHEVCPIEVPGCFLETMAVPDLDVSVRFDRVATQPACNSPAYAAVFRLTFQSRQADASGAPVLQGQVDLAWGGQRVGDPTASGGHGFAPIGAQGYVGYSYPTSSHSNLEQAAHHLAVTLASDGPEASSALGAITHRTLTLSISYERPRADDLDPRPEQFAWTGSGPADLFAQLVEPPGACLPP
ncbi:MAG: hypothetical protein QOI63_635, partial [Thermoplasmata archaeon]|nr:hypothetical protein [Thermoplasmata archaeon]